MRYGTRIFCQRLIPNKKREQSLERGRSDQMTSPPTNHVTIKTTLTLCHVERSRSECDDVVETSRGCQSPKMQTQGVLPKDCPRNRISRPHCSARSCQRGFVVSTKAFFFCRRRPFSCFSR